jgi:hypothetical protein
MALPAALIFNMHGQAGLLQQRALPECELTIAENY